MPAVFTPLLAATAAAVTLLQAPADPVRAEHAGIGNTNEVQVTRPTHPGAQWFPDAGLGLFIHWGIASVKAMNISWPMFDRGDGAKITPDDYWAMAPDFQPRRYDPDRWLKAARQAGFKYAVFTTRHHEGYAMWPSAFGDLGTRTHMGGRDLVKDFVRACRKHGLKVGFYYSPPDWYFDREFMNFTRKKDAPPRGPDGKDRTTRKSPEEEARHKQAYAAMVRGQLEELLTKYGKIDLLWFDGRPRGLTGDEVITIDRIRQLQPHIVVNPRLHRHGDYRTYERTMKLERPRDEWAEFCNTWTNYWPHVDDAPFRAPGFVLGDLATSRSLGVNYLLGVGPTKDGEFVPAIYQNMQVVADWMKRNRRSIDGTRPLPPEESASVPATARGKTRFLFALPAFKDGGKYQADLLPPVDTTLTWKGAGKPRRVRLLSDGAALKHSWADGQLTIELPAAKRSDRPDVVSVEL
jgi:alpha-L-fucosidase